MCYMKPGNNLIGCRNEDGVRLFSWRPAAAGETPSMVPRTTPSLYGTLTLALLTVVTVVLGFFPGPLTSWLIGK